MGYLVEYDYGIRRIRKMHTLKGKKAYIPAILSITVTVLICHVLSAVVQAAIAGQINEIISVFD